jgi:hypothetical protein
VDRNPAAAAAGGDRSRRPAAAWGSPIGRNSTPESLDVFADMCEAKARELENGELSGEWEDAIDYHFLAEQEAAYSSVGPGVQQQQQQGLGYSSRGMGVLGGDAVSSCSSSGVSDVTEVDVDWLDMPGGIADAAGSSAPATAAAVAAMEGAAAAAADSSAGSSPPTAAVAAVQATTAANSSAGSSPPVLGAAAASGGGEGELSAVQAGPSRAADGECSGPAWDDLD